jgi:acetyl esterase/lipase
MVFVACLGAPAVAHADLTSLKASCEQRDAADGDTANGAQLPFTFCDDGVPDVGGRTPNVGAVKAVAVPQSYGGDGFSGLPPKAAAQPNTGADPDGNIALDVDVSLPDPGLNPKPPGGYPLVVMMHGCCSGSKASWEAPSVDAGGERWHYSNAWFAARGYVVLTFTARGFVDGSNRGSTGETQLDSRRFEVNDYQHLAGQLADDAFFGVDPERVVTTGGSYGGGFSWLALTDPTWASPGGKDMRLVASAPKYGWTDLVYSLVPNGTHPRDALPATDGSSTTTPFGFPKRSINAALYASGKTGVPPGSSHTTFPAAIDEAMTCLQSSDPFDQNPLCAGTIGTTLPEFINDRSAYYQNEFFSRLAGDPGARVPLFSAGTLTDPLFTPVEHRRMVERLKATSPGYPVQEYYGDYNHFVQNKAKEWGDLCGSDDHVCRIDDYPGGDLNAEPAGFKRRGVTTLLDRFVDFYAKPTGNPAQGQPLFDVTASLQVCPQNAASSGVPADEPGERFTAATFDALAPNTLTVKAEGSQATTNDAEPNTHATHADPVGNTASNGSRCPVESSPGLAATAGPGVATYDSQALPTDYTMIGRTRAVVPHTGMGPGGFQLNARLYDLFPDGTQVMVDRGVRSVAAANETTTFDLHGNGWRFPKGHRLRIELAQDDDPYVKASNQPSSLTLSGVTLLVPVREGSTAVAGGAAPPPGAGGTPAAGSGPAVKLTSPRLASDESRDRRFLVRFKPAAGTGAIDHYELQVRESRRKRYRTVSSKLRSSHLRFRGAFGRTYRFRGRAVDRRGVPGGWSQSTTVVPLDDYSAGKGVRYRGSWTRARVRGAYMRRVSRSSTAGSRAALRFRGRRVYLVARTSRRGGKLVVSIDGRRRVVSLRSRKAANRRVVWSRGVKAGAAHRLEVRVISGMAEIDAVGILDRR